MSQEIEGDVELAIKSHRNFVMPKWVHYGLHWGPNHQKIGSWTGVSG